MCYDFKYIWYLFLVFFFADFELMRFCWGYIFKTERKTRMWKMLLKLIALIKGKSFSETAR